MSESNKSNNVRTGLAYVTPGPDSIKLGIDSVASSPDSVKPGPDSIKPGFDTGLMHGNEEVLENQQLKIAVDGTLEERKKLLDTRKLSEKVLCELHDNAELGFKLKVWARLSKLYPESRFKVFQPKNPQIAFLRDHLK